MSLRELAADDDRLLDELRRALAIELFEPPAAGLRSLHAAVDAVQTRGDGAQVVRIVPAHRRPRVLIGVAAGIIVLALALAWIGSATRHVTPDAVVRVQSATTALRKDLSDHSSEVQTSHDVVVLSAKIAAVPPTQRALLGPAPLHTILQACATLGFPGSGSLDGAAAPSPVSAACQRARGPVAPAAAPGSGAGTGHPPVTSLPGNPTNSTAVAPGHGAVPGAPAPGGRPPAPVGAGSGAGRRAGTGTLGGSNPGAGPGSGTGSGRGTGGGPAPGSDGATPTGNRGRYGSSTHLSPSGWGDRSTPRNPVGPGRGA
jgi:hypothetical protein